MQEYKILIPIGGHLPQAGAVISSQDKDFKGAPSMIQVATITEITWGTKRIDGTDKVAGIFVTLLGMPYPQIKLTSEQERARAHLKHFVVYDSVSGEAKACFSGDDMTQEVHAMKCPVCRAKRHEQERGDEANAESTEETGNSQKEVWQEEDQKREEG